ncbi:hypothetical protein ASPNIDRAFT_37001 [Aspergillus niger ATCC 1015]|uniref:Xylanolytic transcriptional activator regulatory domain-containing protein n=1 Tax=Aspergillus niger (strain ATCC 1015 / CBS 113.46 / FGSC A1144 / LSHB Ac4 / NCTC 3858a / NRRL 328 / USDA 3528.7) TaxID=380704 RepID=G3Y3C5_ASPNA|nr:hypothetical protein ASPNIDRAFT_37001 [Aspergillus niger ATCC 1015]
MFAMQAGKAKGESQCSGRPPPCKACQNTGGCIFDETLDLRRKVAARRTQGELEYYRGLLYSLLETLRSSDEEKARQMLEKIRGNAQLNDLVTVIDASVTDFSDASSEHSKSVGPAEDIPSQHERPVVDAHLRITVEKLCDSPLFQVPSGPWTAVTKDDHIVSHLISLYFTWDHPLLQVLDQEMFLEHMSTKETDPNCCTSLLVNSILAVAKVFAIPDDETSRGEHFYAEAERLWNAEEGRASLANIQAVALMSRFLKFRGKDDLSWLMLRQAVQLAQDFGMFASPRTRHRQWEKMSLRLQHACAITAWGLFILNSYGCIPTQMSLHSRKIAELKPPKYKPYPQTALDDKIMWTPYPRFNEVDHIKKPAYLRFVMTKLIDLTEIVADIPDLLFDKGIDMAIGELWIAANKKCVRLQRWLDSLPNDIENDDEKPPQILYLYIGYHHTIITVFQFFLEHQHFGPASHPSEFEQARSYQLRSAKQVVHCLRSYHESYGLRQIPRQILEPTHSSLLVFLGALNEDDSKDAFVELCRFLVAFSKRFALAKEMLRNLEDIVHSSRLTLPPEAVAVLDHRGQDTSQWL